MNKEFHYYITYYLALKAGFSQDDSYLLAYSCQLTDDNSCQYKITGQDEDYSNYVSQTMNILQPRSDLMRIYFCFHFVPGDYDENIVYRKDGKLHLLNTTPNSKHANLIMQEALKTGNIFRIGLAAHSFADTWAHQNFVGIYDHFNSHYSKKDNVPQVIPNIGHATALTHPDHVGLTWQDARLIDKHKQIDNSSRFLDAARHLYRYLRQYINAGISTEELEKEWKGIEKAISAAMGPAHNGQDTERDKRIAAYKALLGKEAKDYDEQEWFNTAVETRVRGFKDNIKNFVSKFFNTTFIPDKYIKKENFEDSSWYRFQEAVKEHQKFVLDLLEPLGQKMQLSDMFKI